MPIQKVKGGYKWGKSGKVYPTKAQAAKQARAAYASGYKGYQTGGKITQSEDPFAPNFEYDPTGGTTTTVGGPRESVSFGPSILDTFLFGGAGLTGPWQGRGAFRATPETRLARGLFDPNLGPSGVARVLAQREAIKRLAQEYGPIVSLINNQGGLLGLGTSGIGGLGIEKTFRENPIGAAAKIANRIKLAQIAPGIAGLGYFLNQIQEVDPNQKGILGGTLGPQLRNLFSRFLPIKTFAEKEAENVDKYPYIQEVEVTAEKRETDSMREERERAERAARVRQFADESLENRIAETGGDPSAYMYGLVPGAAQSTNQGLRALNFKRRMAKRKTPSKKDWYRPDRKISSGRGSRK
jgi:hypothetical protein|tara:strand:+ start:2044 stop:3105 length:1062 start_codon:yes stop_codon:yes gene_type:complete